MPPENTPGGTPGTPVGGTPTTPQPPQTPDGETPPATFEQWLAQQDDHTKSLLDSHTSGLRNALNSERETRKGLEKQLRDAAAKLDQGSDARKQLDELAAQVEEGNKLLAFYDTARAAKIVNPRLAYMAARQDNLFKRNGDVDIEALRQAYPELFEPAQPTRPPAGNAGAGTQRPPAQNDMNSMIRRAAGRES